MRTELDINDALLEAARRRAEETRQSLTEVIEDALRLVLQPALRLDHRVSGSLPASGSGGLQPGIDLDRGAALRDTMDDQACNSSM